MPDFRHLFPPGTGTSEQYTYAKTVRGGGIKLRVREDKVAHAESLITAIQGAESAPTVEVDESAEEPKGLVLEFISDPGFNLQIDSLENLRSGFELRNATVRDGIMYATVFIPDGKVELFLKKFQAYLGAPRTNGKPHNRTLVESIGQIRLAALSSFWTDVGTLPVESDNVQWWEIWLRELPAPENVADVFRARATNAGATCGGRELRFPEHRVLLVKASTNQLVTISNLFDILAEIRTAKILPAEFVALTPRDQAEFIEKALERIIAPPGDAPAVTHLDTGVNRGHALLAPALAENAMFTCNPEWGLHDAKGHGTEMAGLALYGDLTSLLNSEETCTLRHCLESVKIFPTGEANEPELYGDITAQAVSLVEIAAPDRNRALCLTITSDGRDLGLPSSWSAAVDQICSGAMEEDKPPRLMFISAGNTSPDGRHNYPAHNYTEGVEDPSQSFNAITVGAFTEMTTIHEKQYAEWKPIGISGRLSPSSRTSIIWEKKSWPLKPDIVMEGGNSAIDPNTGKADYVYDLSLLTTRLSIGSGLLTPTGDTSAAAATAARCAAIIWAHYPKLRPETVRALLVHSARWTPAMLEEFSQDKHSRLRVYGYGVPNLKTALWSASNCATVIIEDSMQPYDKGKKYKDMQLHRLPWPKEVLEQMGDAPVRMRITLSYFIEPSPGRRGWKDRQRYRSHGLRFSVKRPLETEADFRKRLSKAAWAQEEEAVENVGEDLVWQNGVQMQSKGSVHSDVWQGTAAELASCGALAIFPVSGWWRDRTHLNKWGSLAHYSLIVSLETDRTDVDLYTPIAQQIGVDVVAVIET